MINTAYIRILIIFCVLCAVPPSLDEALPVVRERIEKQLSVSQSLAWKYTAVLEKLTNSDRQRGEREVPIVLLKQALYNVRQHEVFLKMLLVRKNLLV